MRSRRKPKNQEVDIADLYALKVGALWQALKNEHIAFWFLCIYFFFEYIRPQSLYPVLDVMPYSQIFMLAALLTMFMDESVGRVSNKENKLFVVFALIVVLSGFMAFRPEISWQYRNVMLGWFVVYFMTIRIVNTERRLILFLLAYLLFSFKMAQHGTIVWAQRGFSFSSWGLVGSPGYFRNSGDYAIQMLIYGSLAVAVVYSLKDYWGRTKRWLMYFVAATGYLAVMGASSRGSQLGLAVIGVWILLRQKGGLKGLIAMAVLAGGLLLVLPDEQIARFTEMGDDVSSLQRLAHWEYGLNEIIPSYPILGVGYNNWLVYIYSHVPGGLGPKHGLMDSHNIYIQAASELGLLGLATFLALIIYAFINNVRTRRMAKELDNKLLFNVAYGLDAGLIGYLVAGSFVTVLYYPFFWIQITMIVMLNNVASTMVVKKEKDPGSQEL